MIRANCGYTLVLTLCEYEVLRRYEYCHSTTLTKFKADMNSGSGDDHDDDEDGDGDGGEEYAHLLLFSIFTCFIIHSHGFADQSCQSLSQSQRLIYINCRILPWCITV